MTDFPNQFKTSLFWEQITVISHCMIVLCVCEVMMQSIWNKLEERWSVMASGRERCAAKRRFRLGFAAGDSPKNFHSFQPDPRLGSGGIFGRGPAVQRRPRQGGQGVNPLGHPLRRLRPPPAAVPGAAPAARPGRASTGEAVYIASPELFLNTLK